MTNTLKNIVTAGAFALATAGCNKEVEKPHNYAFLSYGGPITGTEKTTRFEDRTQGYACEFKGFSHDLAQYHFWDVGGRASGILPPNDSRTERCLNLRHNLFQIMSDRGMKIHDEPAYIEVTAPKIKDPITSKFFKK